MWRTVLAVVGILAASAAPGRAQGLFAEAPASFSLEAAEGLGVVRSRPVRIRLGRIPGASAREAARGVLPPRGHRLVLNLFDDVVVHARMTRSERAGNALVWTGKIEGQPMGDVVLAVVDGVLTGSVVSPEGAYRIAVQGGMTVVQQLDHSQFPEDGCFKEVPGGTGDVGASPVVNADDGSLIDVLVVYTPAARSAAGNTSAMQSLISTAIAETNTGYANSGVVQRLRLAGTAEVSYTEVDISTDLSNVTGTSDGYMDSVHTLRNTYQADEVVLIGEGYSACGVAWLMAGNDPSFAPYAFAVVDRTCATGYYSFGHELGHNMGLNHARTDPVGTGAYSYSYGYKNPSDAFRTVMAYCCGYETGSCRAGCPRVLYFSNPNVTYGGNPTGVSQSSASSAYNALSLNNTRVTVANWRQSPTPASIRVVTPNGGESWPAGSTHAITWTSANLPAGAVVNVTYSDGTARGFTTNRTAGGAIARVPASQGSYSWTVPDNAGSSWRVKLCVPTAALPARGASGPSCLASDASDAPFSIVP